MHLLFLTSLAHIEQWQNSIHQYSPSGNSKGKISSQHGTWYVHSDVLLVPLELAQQTTAPSLRADVNVHERPQLVSWMSWSSLGCSSGLPSSLHSAGPHPWQKETKERHCWMLLLIPYLWSRVVSWRDFMALPFKCLKKEFICAWVRNVCVWIVDSNNVDYLLFFLSIYFA